MLNLKQLKLEQEWYYLSHKYLYKMARCLHIPTVTSPNNTIFDCLVCFTRRISYASEYVHKKSISTCEAKFTQTESPPKQLATNSANTLACDSVSAKLLSISVARAIIELSLESFVESTTNTSLHRINTK